MADNCQRTSLPDAMGIVEIRVFILDVGIACSKQRSIAADCESQLVASSWYYPTLAVNDLDSDEGKTILRESSLVCSQTDGGRFASCLYLASLIACHSTQRTSPFR